MMDAEISEKNVFAAYAAKEKPIYGIVSDSAKVLAGVLKNVVYSLGIDIIVIAGKGVKFGKKYLSVFQEAIRSVNPDVLVKFSERKEAALHGAIFRAVEIGINNLIEK